VLQLKWVKSVAKEWLRLDHAHLNNVDAQGVYVVWYNGQPGRVVRVGSGDIRTRLTADRRDRDVMAYGRFGLFVTWASVDAEQIDGVRRFLADQYPPLVADAGPQVQPIAVNTPW
jgi:hypothetical protein